MANNKIFKPEENPFTTAFGMVPHLYIEPEDIVNDIFLRLHSKYVTENCFMLTGIRGSGKTVTLTDVEARVEKESDFIVISLSSTREMLRALISRLYDSNKFINSFISANLNLSLFGIGMSIEGNPPEASLESALVKILDNVKKAGKKLLITIDEVSKSEDFIEFAKVFNLLSRKGYPIYLMLTGLPENMTLLEDTQDLTFLRRAHKYNMEPLNITLIRQKYMTAFGIDLESAYKLALITRGYPVAYQALGQHLWESGSANLSSEVLQKFDDTMSVKVYSSIWKSLSETEKMYLLHMTGAKTKVSDLLSATGKNAAAFSPYRERLIIKGIINAPDRGVVAFTLPRFEYFIAERKMLEDWM